MSSCSGMCTECQRHCDDLTGQSDEAYQTIANENAALRAENERLRSEVEWFKSGTHTCHDWDR